ncbi:MAG: hypothetical protein ACKV2T_01115 [Kofleriaceae bacterium]
MKRTFAVYLFASVAGCAAESDVVERIDHQVLPDPGMAPISTTTQVVHLRPQAAYFDALRDQFGLDREEARLRGMIRANIQRAFAAYDVAVAIDEIELQGATPDQVLTIDFYGIDPSGSFLTNYHNDSRPKDTGNLIRDEHLGGFDQTSADEGYPGQGGVFIGSMFGAFGDDSTRNDPTADRFHDVFAPFAPALGGTPPTFADDPTIAISVLATFAASEATHLIGHSIGLPNGPGFHNEGDNGCVMDNGAARSFVERSRLDGEAERWCPDEASYLDSILRR